MNRFLLALPLAVALTACGGGGDEGGGTTPPPPPPSGDGIVTTVPAPTYTLGSEELAAFEYLNDARSSCGFGKLAQNTQLDSAARGHADWITFHKIPGHYQTVGTDKFTGVTAEDRAVAAGYAAAGTFFIQDESSYNGGTFGNDKTGFGLAGMRGLLNAPYHALGLTDGYRDVGISVRNAFDAGASDAGVVNQGRKALVINPARRSTTSSQLSHLAASDVLTYPCAGSTGIERALYSERPNPVPGRDLLTNPLGSSVQVAIKEGHTLTIDSASMVVTSTMAAVTLRDPITSANDPHGPCSFGCFPSNRGYIVADAPLAANTTYTVTISGKNNGASFTISFDFTTGAN